jgi:hypothetical protein
VNIIYFKSKLFEGNFIHFIVGFGAYGADFADFQSVVQVNIFRLSLKNIPSAAAETPLSLIFSIFVVNKQSKIMCKIPVGNRYR